MKVLTFILNLNSEHPEELSAFYRDVVGLEPDPPIGERAFKVGNSHVLIDGHSEVKGPVDQPGRALINFFVENIDAEHARLTSAGVPCIRALEREAWGGIFSTFVDPDGNYFQLVEFRPE